MSESPTADWNWINAAADRFEQASKEGPRPRIEDYLAQADEPRRPALLEELLRVELELRRRAGEQPTAEEYRGRFPGSAEVLEVVFAEPNEGPAHGDCTPPDDREHGESIHRPQLGSLLAGLAETTGSVPCVLLRDTESSMDEPLVLPTSPEMPRDEGRYQILGEIGRGGMGAVMKGRDPDLGRDLAVKVLLEEHKDEPDLVRRFIEEAQIGGQLQHPGIVPVYELGAFSDRRPFFTMKLVKGRTLAELLKGRGDPADELPRFLGIFEQVCQTVAYAHARSVIHRDLKPSNIMVGAFGEVQVMDWGFAKVLPKGGTADEPRHDPEEVAVSVIRTVRTGSDACASRPGSAMGTPAYMPPEQAGGDVDSMDERTDVFALGSILCELLTGSPAYTGSTQKGILRKAIRGDTAEAVRRLEACLADRELVALARRCLAVDRDERPRNAGAVAAAVTAYLSGVQERLKAAELARAAETARAEEAQATALEAQRRARAERKARRFQAGLAASALAVTILGGLSTTYYLQQLQERAAITDRVVSRALTLLDQALAQPDDLSRWQVALAAVQQAEASGDVNARDRLAALRTKIQAGFDEAERDRKLLDRLVDIRSAEADDLDGSATDDAYAEAFRDAEIDLASLPPAEAGARIRARPQSVALALAGALDDWAAIRRRVRADAAGSAELSVSAIAADPDPWRNKLRSAVHQSQKVDRLAALRALVREAKFEELGPISLHLLGTGLYDAGDSALAETVLKAAQQRHPRDVWVNYALGTVLESLSRRDEAIRFYTAARSIRPETAHELAHALAARGESDEAIALFRDLKGLRPGNARHLDCLGFALKDKGLSRQANEAFAAAVTAGRAAIWLKPDDAIAHLELGRALSGQRKIDEAIGEFRTAIGLKPYLVTAHFNLGQALHAQGKPNQAIAEYREAIRLKPDYPEVYQNLGAILCDVIHDYAAADKAFREEIRLRPGDVTAHLSLGNALSGQRKLDAAITEYRCAIELKRDYAEAHSALGAALRDQAKLDQAIAEYRSAIRLKPSDAFAHNNLGAALSDQGKLDEAISEYRTAIQLEPGDASAHNNLGAALKDQAKLEEAIAEYRTAIQLKPEFALAHCNLGIALSDQGRVDAAIAEYQTAIQLKPDYAEPHQGLGTALYGRGKLEDAMAEYRRAIRLNPSNAAAHHSLGLALSDQGRVDAANTEYRTAIELKPEDSGAHVDLGNTLYRQGKVDKAIAEYRIAIRLNPDGPIAHNNLGNALSDQGKLDQAVAAFHAAIKIKPDLARAHFNLALTLAKQGRLDEAVPEYREVIRLRPDDARAHNELAWALVGSPGHPRGVYDEGLQHARKAVELAPNNGNSFNTLSLAEYRSGHWSESVSATEKSMALSIGGIGSDYFFMSMAMWQQGKKAEARTWFDKAVAWTKEKKPKDKELLRFWKEAAELLSQPGPEADVAPARASQADSRK